MGLKSFTIVASDFVQTGGMDRANYALASYLARAGHRVTLVAHRVASELAALAEIDVRRVWKPLGSNFLGQWPLGRAGQRAAQAGDRVVVNGANCLFPDINWVHYVHAAYKPDVRVSRLRQLKSWIDHSLNLPAERAAFQAARVVICNSDLTRRHVVELCGVDSAKVITIYLGADPIKFCPAPAARSAAIRERLGWPRDRRVVLFIGALGDRRKGFDTLFEAWASLCKAGDWDCLLVVVGSGAERPAWERRAAAAGFADRIQFLAFRSDVPDLLQAADILVAPARYEAYGLGVQEALCCGLPAMVSASAGIAERYPPELVDLLLPDPNDAADLATRLQRWHANAGEWRDRVRPFSDFLRQYTWDDMSRRILQVCS